MPPPFLVRSLGSWKRLTRTALITLRSKNCCHSSSVIWQNVAERRGLENAEIVH